MRGRLRLGAVCWPVSQSARALRAQSGPGLADSCARASLQDCRETPGRGTTNGRVLQRLLLLLTTPPTTTTTTTTISAIESPTAVAIDGGRLGIPGVLYCTTPRALERRGEAKHRIVGCAVRANVNTPVQTASSSHGAAITSRNWLALRPRRLRCTSPHFLSRRCRLLCLGRRGREPGPACLPDATLSHTDLTPSARLQHAVMRSVCVCV